MRAMHELVRMYVWWDTNNVDEEHADKTNDNKTKMQNNKYKDIFEIK